LRHWLPCMLAGLVAAMVLRGAIAPARFQGPSAGIVAVRWATSETLDQLGTVWYYTYGFDGPSDAHHQRVLLVPPHFDEARLSEVLLAEPRRWWIVGNEPNDPFQDNLTPTAYAAFYHRFCRLASRLDPTYRVMPAGIANADWRWAEAFREAYRSLYGRYPRVDAWNVHGYVLDPELRQTDLDAFQSQLIDFRAWMARVGDADKALILSEFGVLMGQNAGDARYEQPEAIVEYIQTTVRWLYNTDYVQSFAWFADYTDGAFNGDLYTAEGALSLYGEAYRGAIQSHTAPASPDGGADGRP
jgi:hypothetical protein